MPVKEAALEAEIRTTHIVNNSSCLCSSCSSMYTGIESVYCRETEICDYCLFDDLTFRIFRTVLIILSNPSLSIRFLSIKIIL